MGLTVSIYKDGGKTFSNGGVSQFMDSGVLVNVEGPSEPDFVRTAALLLVPGNIGGTAKVVPAVLNEAGEWVEANTLPNGKRLVGPMMGGCYVASSDGRFGDAVEALTGSRFYGAVPLHDRFETPAEYAVFSA